MPKLVYKLVEDFYLRSTKNGNEYKCHQTKYDLITRLYKFNYMKLQHTQSCLLLCIIPLIHQHL